MLPRLLRLRLLLSVLPLQGVHALATSGAAAFDAAFRFPTPQTQPAEVVLAQLKALRKANIPQTYHLFSRARRLEIDEGARRDMREKVRPERAYAVLVEMLTRDCPGLVGHRSSEIVGSLGDPEPQQGLLPKWVYRVNVDDTRHFVFTLTRQSRYDGGDPRDYDGFEGCWFVWTITPEDDGGSLREDALAPDSPIPAPSPA
ncbi:hypothetical protein AB1Y20_001079 [Prymnesium parvum]|uniref:Uncharacterized protein n=1 Tax=Prymnesium parvum TaxID=97485 RepID=A0AB34K6P4_PRYPA